MGRGGGGRFSDHQNLKILIKIGHIQHQVSVGCQWFRKMLKNFHSQIWLNCLFCWLSTKPYITNLENKSKAPVHHHHHPPMILMKRRLSWVLLSPLVHEWLVLTFTHWFFWVHGLLVWTFDIYPLVFWVHGLLVWTFDIYPLVFWVGGMDCLVSTFHP